jgi:UDP-N-acetylmuramoyl-L-alanyl-D-glutamate--2,6-diaminopimelate ligase
MEVISQRPLVIVDFAHTPDGMDKVLDSLQDKEISVVFGAGGDRDASKRPLMGRVANRYAKKIYLTNDNPRSEEPLKILEEIDNGITDKRKVTILPDRKDAIEVALDELQDGEILLILGKGDEEYQEIGSEKVPFDDRVVTRGLLKEKFNL